MKLMMIEQIRKYCGMESDSGVPVNTGRQPALDIARGLSVAIMVLVHVFQQYAAPEVHRSLFGTGLFFLGGPPAAPVFMFLMGAGMVYSRKADIRQMVYRGLKLIVLGYILSLVESVLPIHIAIWSGCYPTEFFFHKFKDISAFAQQINILHFAGISHLLIALFKLLRIRWRHFVLPALMISLLAPLLWGQYTQNSVVNHFIEPLWGDRIWVRYPLFAWAVYPLMGAWFGAHLQHVGDKRSFYKVALAIGVCGMAIGLGLAALLGRLVLLENLDAYYKRHSIEGHLCIVSFVVIWIAIIYFVGQKLPKRIVLLFTFWSKQVTVIYVVHGVLIGWGIFLIPARIQGLWTTLLLTVFVLFFSDGLGRLYHRRTKKTKKEVVS